MKAIALLSAATLFVTASYAADAKKDEVIKDVMKKYHKPPAGSPQGTDHAAKKAADGKATPAEIKELVEAYTKMVEAHPPKGDAASWKEKSSKLVAAIKALEKGDADGVAKFKEASNCRNCHTVHRPPQP